MIIDIETKEYINNCVNEYVPEGVHELYHVNCREHMVDIIEAFIERNVIKKENSSIEAVCLCWNEFMYKKFSLLN